MPPFADLASHSLPPSKWAILTHGGAGDIDPSQGEARKSACLHAAKVGAEILARGGSALDAVQAAVRALESDPLFNAGTGASLDEDGHIALDASVMEGKDLRAGGVCALPPYLHPIDIARAVMEDGRHVLLAGEGAARFADSKGFQRSSHEQMTTEGAQRAWLRTKERLSQRVGWAGGTVGAVAKDAQGNVASATSTGGTVNKLAGRIGDSPIIGAGTYAENECGAASNTGHGEAVMRLCLAKFATDRMRVDDAEACAREAIETMQRRTSGRGGIILVRHNGETAFARNTTTMAWGAVNAEMEEAGL